MKEIKEFVVSVNDFLMIVLIIGAAVAGGVVYGFLGAIGGLLLGCVLSGWWCVVSGIYHSTKKNAELMQKVLDEMKGPV